MAIAKATCTCSTCGKTFEYRKTCYNRRDADSFESWAADHITECTDCYKARMVNEAEEARAAKGWPALTGSEKQIAWALKIREEEIDHLLPRIYIEDRDQFVRDWLGTLTESRYWIDNRGNTFKIAKDCSEYYKTWSAK